MITEAGAAVVVGADGSASSLAAIRAAATDAVERGRPLRIVHAFIWAELTGPDGGTVYGPHDTRMRADAERILAAALVEAEKAAPGVHATTAVVDGNPAPVLLSESRNAVLLVIGDRGLDGFRSLLLGSVALHLTTYAACPVLVIRGREHATGPIIVGVDGSTGSEAAIGFAIEQAARRKTGLTAVRAWDAFDVWGQKDTMPLVSEPGDLEAEEHRVLSESLAGWAQRYPEVTVQQEIVRGRAATVLIEQSQHAQLLVTGDRGRGGFAGLLLGSVTQTVLHHAHCSVAVVRPTPATI
ncbi:nucleotide-binding universal stress UspA family protein [Actinoplanes lutulentus]|uniref:Nucleotide-binding universal stress UspA family protein n=1 Tax=Actinoplanes lutulentus TaxID=1287878 RepID=A0A327Z1Q7_9ACTN|nr:universal stress protein [Actinoplanes lutulentus]MBB2946370.1 nucleotide-binding universal stress UspA family protein [Actinoplanes lutulentus]RAK28690.1 nucleotide-binding universal stress UspA family protein [Actinoplanes lutulentus]